MIQTITNTPAGSGLGDTLKIAFDKVNANFQYLSSSYADTGSVLLLQSQIDNVSASLSNYSPINHTHVISDIQDLQTTLDSLVTNSTFNTAILGINSTIIDINQDISNLYLLLSSGSGTISTGSFATTGSNLFSGSQTISGSLTVTQGITGSLNGTATNAITASYSQTTLAAGANTQVQFNSGSRLAAVAGVTVNSSTQGLQNGNLAIASGSYSHAQGYSTEARGPYSHAEGNGAIATGPWSHAEGGGAQAIGTASHAEGAGTVALGDYQHVQGRFNISSSASSAFIIGNGVTQNSRSNLVFASGSQFQITGSLQMSGSIVNPNSVQFNVSSSETTSIGKLNWNDTDGTLDLGLKGGNVTLQVGQEQVVRVVNKSGVDLLEANYQVVRIRLVSEGGAQGQRLAVVLAQGDNDTDSATTLGIVTETILNNQEGFVTVLGEVRKIDTTGALQGETWVDGDMLYISPTTPGKLTNIKPVAPSHAVFIGYVVYSHAVNGKVFVNVQNGYEIGELHNVDVSGSLNGEVLTYQSSSGVWKNQSVVSALGYTPYNATNPSNYITSAALAPYVLNSQTSSFVKNSQTSSMSVATASYATSTVSGSIQGQLDGKQPLIGYTPFKWIATNTIATSGSVVGLSETIVGTATILGGTFNNSDIMKVFVQTSKPLTANTVSYRIKINTTNTLSGAVQIGSFSTTNTLSYAPITRTYTLTGNNLIGNFTNAVSDLTNIGGNIGTTAYNTSNTLYVFFTVQLSNTADSATINLMTITN